jgi:prolyl-tRNA editing enzyme YbaK/EbsC (Cys-tRNA(Pro) deacylase)
MQPAGYAPETRKQIGCIYARPVCHVDTRLDIDAVRRRMENKKLEMMSDGGTGCRVGFDPHGTRQVSSSEP